jgi:hypothetical protein
MKMKFDISSWRIDSVRILGKKRGGRPILVRFISFTKKLKMLQASRNLTGTKIKIEQNYGTKVTEIRRQLILYLKDARQQGNTANFRKGKLVVNRREHDLVLQENYQIKKSKKKKYWITLRQRIMLHISGHHGDKYRRSTERKKVQLEDTCRIHRTHLAESCTRKLGGQAIDVKS